METILSGFHSSVGIWPYHPITPEMEARAEELLDLLAIRDKESLAAAVRSWRISMGAGFFGAAASAGWFIALALAPAGLVRAVGVVEMPLAALAGRRLFAERVSLAQWIAGGVTALGVALAALG
jgi:drug/metabolite transporter (DMT)-like permease